MFEIIFMPMGLNIIWLRLSGNIFRNKLDKPSFNSGGGVGGTLRPFLTIYALIFLFIYLIE